MPAADSNADARKGEVFRVIGLKGEFRRTAAKMLRETPEYQHHRQLGQAKVWLDGEAKIAADMLYEAMQAFIEEKG